MSGPRRPRLSLALWTGLVLGATTVLHQAGSGALAAPPLTSVTRWPPWLASLDPVLAGFAVARLVGLATAWYLMAVTVAGAVLRELHAVRLAALVDRITVPSVRRLLATTMSLSLAATGLSARAAGAQPASPPPTITMHRLPDAAPSTSAPANQGPSGPSEREAQGPSGPSEREAQGPSGPSEREAQGPSGPSAAGWEVEAGQCLWSISEAVLTRAWGRPPTDAEIVPHWRQLIELNRHVLADPDNPDLIYPGQVFTIPAPDSAEPVLAQTS